MAATLWDEARLTRARQGLEKILRIAKKVVIVSAEGGIDSRATTGRFTVVSKKKTPSNGEYALVIVCQYTRHQISGPWKSDAKRRDFLWVGVPTTNFFNQVLKETWAQLPEATSKERVPLVVPARVLGPASAGVPQLVPVTASLTKLRGLASLAREERLAVYGALREQFESCGGSISKNVLGRFLRDRGLDPILSRLHLVNRDMIVTHRLGKKEKITGSWAPGNRLPLAKAHKVAAEPGEVPAQHDMTAKECLATFDARVAEERKALQLAVLDEEQAMLESQLALLMAKKAKING